MTSIHIQVKGLKEVERALGDVHKKQLPFAISKGVNDTVRAAQRAMQVQMGRSFTLRGTEPMFQRAVRATFSDYRKKGSVGSVFIEGPASGAISTAARVARMILRHETGGSHTSSATYRTVRTDGRALGFFLPAKGLRTPSHNAPRRLYPANIGVQKRRDADGSTFYATNQKGRKLKRGAPARELSYFATVKGIFERRHFGSGSAVRLLWWFKRSITLKPRLRFYETVQGKIDATLSDNVSAAIAHAIKTAK